MRYPHSRPTRRHLLDLPDELILDILKNLDHEALLHCTSLCRRICSLVNSSAELNYKIECAVDGLSDCADAAVSYTERLRAVLDRRKSWASMDWRKSFAMNIPGESRAYELVDGVFAKLTDSRRFFASYLPSIRDVAGEPEKKIRSELDFAARDFAMDPSQDLIIYLEDDERRVSWPEDTSWYLWCISGRSPLYRGRRTVSLHVYSLATNKPHPLAKSPRISFDILPAEPGASNNIEAGFIQIAEDVVVVHYATNEEACHFLLWQWTTGNQWMSRSLDDFMDFAFISPRAFFLTSTENCGRILIYTLEFDNATFNRVPQIIPSTILEFPPLQPLVWVEFIGAHTSPIVAHPSPEKVAVPSLRSYIHVTSIKYLFEGLDYPCSLYVPNSILSKYASKGGPSVVVPWSEWGPKNTRFMERTGTSPWLRFVHGYRVVGPPLQAQRLSGPSRHTIIQLYDFNPYSRKVHQSSDPGDRAQVELCEEPTTIERVIFRDTIVTHLPYRRTLCAVAERYSAFLIDDERIMALKVNPSLENDFDDVDILAF